MGRMRTVGLIAILALAAAVPARADATAFIGANTTPANRAVRGFAVGAGLLIVAFEFEYASTSSDDRDRRAVAQDRDAATSCCRRRSASSASSRTSRPARASSASGSARITETSFAPNTGGGVKMSLVGPLQLRVDYRVFKLGNGALYSPAHRVYAGLNLKF